MVAEPFLQAREAMEETAGESGHDPAVVSDAQYFLMGLPRLNFDRAIMRMEVRFFYLFGVLLCRPYFGLGGGLAAPPSSFSPQSGKYRLNTSLVALSRMHLQTITIPSRLLPSSAPTGPR